MIPILTQDVTGMGLLAFLVELCCSFVRGEVGDSITWSSECFANSKCLSSLFELNEGASLMLSRILFLGLLSFLSFGALGFDFFFFFLELLSQPYALALNPCALPRLEEMVRREKSGDLVVRLLFSIPCQPVPIPAPSC